MADVLSREGGHMGRFILAVLLLAAAGLAVAGAAMAKGSAVSQTGPAFYVNGVQYRTVNTPTDLSGTGAPDAQLRHDLRLRRRAAERRHRGTRRPRLQRRPLDGSPDPSSTRARPTTVARTTRTAAATSTAKPRCDAVVRRRADAGGATAGGVVKSVRLPGDQAP